MNLFYFINRNDKMYQKLIKIFDHFRILSLIHQSVISLQSNKQRILV